MSAPLLLRVGLGSWSVWNADRVVGPSRHSSEQSGPVHGR